MSRRKKRMTGFVHIVNKCAHTVRSQYSVRTICCDEGGVGGLFSDDTQPANQRRVESWVALLKVTHQGKIACCDVVLARIDSLTSSLHFYVRWLLLGGSSGPFIRHTRAPLSLTHPSHSKLKWGRHIERSFNIPSYGCSFAHMVLEYLYGQTQRTTSTCVFCPFADNGHCIFISRLGERRRDTL